MQAPAAPVSISANVMGMRMEIGTLDASIPNPANPARVIGEFLFAPGKEFLDDWYDFQWVNVETKYTVDGVMQMNDPVVGRLPAIDPQPGPTEDNDPFYFNATEWANGVFDGVTIHDEGVASRFVDRPADGARNSIIDFTTYLVVNSITDMMFPRNQFCVLGWFDWTYDNMGNSANGVSRVRTVSSVPTAADINLLTMAMGNAGGGGFPGWRATLDCELDLCTPEPTSMVLWVTALAMAGVIRRARDERTKIAA
jgi:hypothetical protein